MLAMRAPFPPRADAHPCPLSGMTKGNGVREGEKLAKPMIVGRPVLVVVDVQKGSFAHWEASDRMPMLPDRVERMERSARWSMPREGGVPVIFFKEEHRANMVDFGRELDGTENVHCLESSPYTPLAVEELGIGPDDYTVTKRRYSCFFGTELEILLKGCAPIR
jgi:nicotinamidase-related amidase